MENKFDANEAIKTLSGIYNNLSLMPVYDESATRAKVGVYTGIGNIAQWINSLLDGDNIDK